MRNAACNSFRRVAVKFIPATERLHKNYPYSRVMSVQECVALRRSYSGSSTVIFASLVGYYPELLTFLRIRHYPSRDNGCWRCSVSSRIFCAPDSLEWKKAYMAAVLEKDRRRLPGLIHEAREKLSKRLRELWLVGAVPCEEVAAIDDALYLLQALLNSLSYRDEAGEWTA